MGLTVRGTVVLVAILAALAAYLWAVELKSLPRSLPQPPALLAVPPAEVARLELEGQGQRLTARRIDSRWADVAGRAWRTGVVSDVLEAVATLRPIMVIDADPAHESDYGLGADATRLQLAAAGGESLLSLEIGDRNPAWTGLYARLAGHREVVLIGAVLRWEIEKLREAAPGR